MIAARFATLLLSALCLSACAAGPPGEPVGRYPAAGGGPGNDAPLATLPPAAGRVVAVRRLPYVNGVGQEIVLDGPRAMAGENVVVVQALTTSRTGGMPQAGDELKLGLPTDTDLAAEMERRLPGVAMSVAAAQERDAEGPLGYASGRMGRLTCIYAWQYIAPARPVSLLEGLSNTGVLPVSVRVRLCREQPLAGLVELLRGLRLSRPDGGGPVLAASRPFARSDALEEAVGSLPTAAPRDDAARDLAAPAADGGASRPPRRRRHRLALHRPGRRRVAAHGAPFRPRVAARRPRDEAPDGAALPRVPMPGEASAEAAAPPRATASLAQAARAPTAEADAMPMPR